MKHIFIFEILTLFLVAFFLPKGSFCQVFQDGSLDYLLSANGYKEIHLGADIKRLEPNKLGYLDNVDSLDADSCFKYCYKDENILNLGKGLRLDLVGFRTYKDKIVNIYLFFLKEDGYMVLQNFEATYGKYTTSPGQFMYDWKTNRVTLSLRYKPTVPMGVAIFTCNNIEKQVTADNVLRKTRSAQGKNLLGSL